MKSISCVLAVILTIGSITASRVMAKSYSVAVDASVVDERNQENRGTVHIFAVQVPRDVSDAHLDMALLEFHVDVTLDESEYAEMTPVIAAYPLTEPLSPQGSPVVSKAFASARNLRSGNGQVVLLDITPIVRAWIANPASNHGLAVGSFAGPKLSNLGLKSNAMGEGKAARVTFYYQPRVAHRLTE